MKRKLTLDHLSEAPQYLTHLDEKNTNDVGFSFLDFIKDELSMDVLSVIITNYKRQASSLLYVLRLDREKLELYESHKTIENNIRYHFSDHSIYLNNKSMGSLYKNAFKKRLNDIIKDLKLNQCDLFEEAL